MPIILQILVKCAPMTASIAPKLETALAVINQHSELFQVFPHAVFRRAATSIAKPMPVLVVPQLALFALSKLYALRVSVATF